MNKSILIIDDDPLVLKTLNVLLTRIGFEVVSAKNGEEAERKITEKKFNLIISDVRMPQRDGVSVIKRLKEMSVELYGAAIPFIFITGYASENVPIEAVRLGAKDYILKPFDMEELVKSVNLHAEL